ncbi:MAG TPA: hypothetical protein VMT89_16050 [Candidatus Acidoferrales bacterium]|nr:hypothetical protein [Candidatus Acidoferrales bacterium]
MRQIHGLLIAGAIFAMSVVLCFNGCGGNDLVVGGMIPLTPTSVIPTATPGLLGPGEPCTTSSQCDSGICFVGTNTCQ